MENVNSSLDQFVQSELIIKPWKVLIYMAADNNLKEESLFALTELVRALKEPSELFIDVIVQFDSGSEVARYDFTKSNLEANPQASINDKKLKKVVPNNLLSDTELLEKFLTENLSESSDGYYTMVVLSGHGSGAVGDFLRSNNPPSALSIPELKNLLKRVGVKIDVLGMDSCLMSMAEVGYDLRESVNILVGAEGFAQNAGWPYHQIISSLKNLPVWEPVDVAKRIVEQYICYYSDYTAVGISVDHAACDLREIDNGLTESLGNLASKLHLKLDDQLVQDAILLAHWRAQSYKFEQYVDLGDFCDLLEKGCEDPAVKIACKSVQDDIKKVVKLSCYSGAAVQFSHGLSIYFPWNEYTFFSEYEHLDFASETGWFDFLKTYIRVTRRKPRTDMALPGAKPKSMPTISKNEPSTPLAVRFDEDRFDEDRGLENRISPMKNLPNEYFDCNSSSVPPTVNSLNIQKY